jgi:hypothetical protein
VQAFDWNVEQFYWRDRGAEVDFVGRAGPFGIG